MKKESYEDIFTQIIDYIKQSIFTQLPNHLYYHNADHTLLDVLPSSIQLAQLEQIGAEEMLLLKVAVLFHDTGFTKQYPNNEEIGAEIASKTLRSFNFSSKQIRKLPRKLFVHLTSRVNRLGEYAILSWQPVFQPRITHSYKWQEMTS
jgi:HD superfamily phosphodiesterase